MGALLAAAAQAPLPATQTTISAMQLLPAMVAVAGGTLLAAHILCRVLRCYYAKRATIMLYSGVPPDYQLKWLVCDVRNSLGYLVLAAGTVVLSIVIAYVR
jgi:hypothetical protein